MGRQKGGRSKADWLIDKKEAKRLALVFQPQMHPWSDLGPDQKTEKGKRSKKLGILTLLIPRVEDSVVVVLDIASPFLKRASEMGICKVPSLGDLTMKEEDYQQEKVKKRCQRRDPARGERFLFCFLPETCSRMRSRGQTRLTLAAGEKDGGFL